MKRIFLVDCEAYGNTPVKGTLTEFGAVDLATGGSFYGRLWLSDPDPDIPAIPIPRSADGPVPLVEIDSIDGSRAEVLADIDAVFVRFAAWVADLSGSDQPVFVSDNPAYDWMWVAAGFDTANLDNPFGYSARRIGGLRRWVALVLEELLRLEGAARHRARPSPGQRLPGQRRGAARPAGPSIRLTLA